MRVTQRFRNECARSPLDSVDSGRWSHTFDPPLLRDVQSRNLGGRVEAVLTRAGDPGFYRQAARAASGYNLTRR
jgi:hypothetical protein